MQHEMRLNMRPFNKIKAGFKTIELRLNDEKRQQIRVGDVIVFYMREDLSQMFAAEVMARLEYKTFAELVFNNPPESMGYDDEFAAMYARGEHGMYEHYSIEDEQKYGVLGLKIRVIS